MGIVEKNNAQFSQHNGLTPNQGNDQSGEWLLQRRGCVTASSFGEIIKRRLKYAPLVIRLIYSKCRTTKAMRYGHENEPKA